jgi:ATP-dependent Clp protease, protease subunit
MAIKLPTLSGGRGTNDMVYHQIDPKIKSKRIEDLVDVPHIILVNKFDEESAKAFREEFSKAVNTNQQIIPVVIDSYGGQVYSLLSMVNTIKNSPVPVATFGSGKMMSCGSVLFTCGSEGHRYMDPFATMMIHDVATGGWGKIEEIKADAKEGERLNQLIFKMMASNCGKEENYFLKLVHENHNADLFLDANECKKHNLCNHIRTPSFKIKVSADISFA